MDSKSLLEAIFMRAPKVREIAKAVDLLMESKNIESFISENSSILNGVSNSMIADHLMITANKLLTKRTSLDIVKNLYNEYSVIYTLCLFGKTRNNKLQFSKLSKIFENIILNSSKFDLFMKINVNAKRISSEKQILEIFWLIPLFVNVPVLIAMDFENFIEENQEIARKVPDFYEGYKHFILNDISSMDKMAYKQYLSDGVVSLAETAVN